MKKIIALVVALLALPILSSCARALAEKPVTGPSKVFAVVNDVPYDEEPEDIAQAKPIAQEIAEEDQQADIEPDIFDGIGYESDGPEINCTAYAIALMRESESEPSSVDSATDLRLQGVVYDEGVRYTWYSQNVLPGGGLDELNANGRTVNAEGFVTDGNGRIAVASSDYPIGTELDTPFGPATVYDTGCASGTIDVYTNF